MGFTHFHKKEERARSTGAIRFPGLVRGRPAGYSDEVRAGAGGPPQHPPYSDDHPGPLCRGRQALSPAGDPLLGRYHVDTDAAGPPMETQVPRRLA